jgi:hypothetical protein
MALDSKYSYLEYDRPKSYFCFMYHSNTNEIHTFESAYFHIIYTNMFRTLLWPSSGCILTRIQSVY